MLWSDKAFSIYIGNAGEGIDPARSNAATDHTGSATDVMASAQTSASRDDCGDALEAPSGGWFTRTVSALANRAAPTRIAGS